MQSLHSRVRPLRRSPQASSIAAAPAPDFKDNDQNEVEETAEDFFETSIPNLFPDDAPQFLGNPGQHLLYTSPSFGDLEIAVPSYPTQNKTATEGETFTKQNGGADDTGRVQEGRILFAHFVWSAGLIAAEGIENAHIYATNPTAMGREAYKIWNVTDQSVLELGAGKSQPFEAGPILALRYCSTTKLQNPLLSFDTDTYCFARCRASLPRQQPCQCIHRRRNGPPLVPRIDGYPPIQYGPQFM